MAHRGSYDSRGPRPAWAYDERVLEIREFGSTTIEVWDPDDRVVNYYIVPGDVAVIQLFVDGVRDRYGMRAFGGGATGPQYRYNDPSTLSGGTFLPIPLAPTVAVAPPGATTSSLQKLIDGARKRFEAFKHLFSAIEEVPGVDEFLALGASHQGSSIDSLVTAFGANSSGPGATGWFGVLGGSKSSSGGGGLSDAIAIATGPGPSTDSSGNPISVDPGNRPTSSDDKPEQTFHTGKSVYVDGVRVSDHYIPITTAEEGLDAIYEWGSENAYPNPVSDDGSLSRDPFVAGLQRSAARSQIGFIAPPQGPSRALRPDGSEAPGRDTSGFDPNSILNPLAPYISPAEGYEGRTFYPPRGYRAGPMSSHYIEALYPDGAPELYQPPAADPTAPPPGEGGDPHARGNMVVAFSAGVRSPTVNLLRGRAVRASQR